MSEQEQAAAGLPVLIRSHPFESTLRPVVMGYGITLADIVAQSGVAPNFYGFIRVWVNDEEIPRDAWPTYFPAPGCNVYVHVTPQGGGDSEGGGKNILASVLMLVVTVAGAVFAPMLAGFLFPSLTGAGLAIATSVIGAGITLVGSLLVGALIKPPGGEMPGQRALLSGVRNSFSPYAEIPRVLGKRRIYPVQAARAYTEAQGKDRYLRVLLCPGWGPLKITDLKIGATPIESFQNIEIEIREGWTDAQFGALPAGKTADEPLTLFTNSVEEDAFSVLLEAATDGSGGFPDTPGPWVSRVSDNDASEIIIDVSFPQGLANFDSKKGNSFNFTVELDVEYRRVGDATWVAVPWAGGEESDGTQTTGKLRCTDNSRSAVWRGGRWKVAGEPGQFEVRLRRITKGHGSKFVSRCEWTALRSVKYQNPVNLPGLCLIALRMKASDQFNSFPDTINCVAESYLPVHDGSGWEYEVTRSPAWAYADLLRRRGQERMVADSRIDIPRMRSWATSCALPAPNAAEDYWSFDGVIERGALFSSLRQIAGHARASFALVDGKFSVVQDLPQTVPVQHITPRNSFGYSGGRSFVDLPHALKVAFVNAERGYQDDEKLVYADGYDEGNATKFEALDMPACTSPTQAWREGRYHLAVGRLRPEAHSVSMDIENLRCGLGDLVRLSHDVISVGVASGRIKSVLTSGGNTTGLILDAAVPNVASKTYSFRIRLRDGSSAVYPVTPSETDADRDFLNFVTPVATEFGPQPGDLFMYGETNLESAPMIITKIEPGPDMTARITMADAQDVYSADTGAIPAFQTYITSDTAVGQLAPSITPPLIRSDETAIRRMTDGTLIERIAVSIPPQVGTGIQAVSLEVQYRLQGQAEYLPVYGMVSDATTVWIDGVTGGEAYDIRYRVMTETGVLSQWQEVLGHVVVGKSTPPAPPTGLSGTGQFRAVWITVDPAPEADFAMFEFYESTGSMAPLVDTDPTFTSLAASFSRTGLPVGTEVNYWIRAVDTSGLKSTWAGPLTLTTSKVVATDIDGRELNVLDIDGEVVFGSSGEIGAGAYVTVDGSQIAVTEIAANSLVPSINFVGDFASAPTEAVLGDAWRQNAVYRNTTDGNSYILTGTPLAWLTYLESGTNFAVTVESSNGTAFKVGQGQSTLLIARLFKNGAEVTGITPASWFRWRRVSIIAASPPNDDATFNAAYGSGGYPQISVTVDQVNARATFFCDIISS